MFKVLKGQDERPIEYVESNNEDGKKSEEWSIYFII
jgi:hypothetical protein